jgi:Asp-tRNA(Asn)/Glu-tRNA(Gln) amidotransferase A subunit family amidase
MPGMMLTGALGDDLGLLQLARAYEQATEWHTMRPAI